MGESESMKVNKESVPGAAAGSTSASSTTLSAIASASAGKGKTPKNGFATLKPKGKGRNCNYSSFTGTSTSSFGGDTDREGRYPTQSAEGQTPGIPKPKSMLYGAWTTGGWRGMWQTRTKRQNV